MLKNKDIGCFKNTIYEKYYKIIDLKYKDGNYYIKGMESFLYTFIFSDYVKINHLEITHSMLITFNIDGNNCILNSIENPFINQNIEINDNFHDDIEIIRNFRKVQFEGIELNTDQKKLFFIYYYKIPIINLFKEWLLNRVL